MDDRPANDDFTVEIFRNGCWEEIFVYNAEVSDYAANPAAGYVQHDMGFAMFTDAFAAPLKVRVTRRAGTFSKVEIRPLSYGIVPNVQTPNSVEFELDDPAQKGFGGVRRQPDGEPSSSCPTCPTRRSRRVPT
ncbi:MAG: hypothetical protein ACLUQ6_13625 [Alistipes onderdonkii]